MSLLGKLELEDCKANPTKHTCGSELSVPLAHVLLNSFANANTGLDCHRTSFDFDTRFFFLFIDNFKHLISK